MHMYDPYAAQGEFGLTSRPAKQASKAWMVTVADLFSLLLTFFVMLYSMSTMPQEKWDAVSHSLEQRLQVQVDEQVPMDSSRFGILRADFIYARGLDYLRRVIDTRFTDRPEMQGVVVTQQEGRITLSLTSDALFAKGSAELSQESYRTLHHISLFLSGIGNRVTIEGHTDPSPIHNAAYPSNWELSMARAAAVAAALRKMGYPYTLDVYGLGSSRYHELASVATDTRDALARRVDIIVRETVAKR